MRAPRYIVGIDLGTTNTVVAFAESKIEKGEAPHIKIFPIAQVVAPGVVERRNLLPSFIYIPTKSECTGDAFALPWEETNGTYVIGEYAKQRSSEAPQRVISSAKSWLCHQGVDREDKILPWQAPEDAGKLSPVEASARILSHVIAAWNHDMASSDPSLRLEEQRIYLTVPASFDAVARELTVRAARLAGLEDITLIEEPQAAFYAWIDNAGDKWRKIVHKGDLVLVCDVGGGTTDFSLIRVAEEDGALTLERIAVGEHLLVGGDNMDLAISYHLAGRLAQKKNRPDPWQMRSLVHSSREAKERLMSDSDIEHYHVTILGRGGGVIGGATRIEISRKDLDSLIMEGFFPVCAPDDRPNKGGRPGLQEGGLPYVPDPGITRHMAEFLAGALRGSDAGFAYPTAVLFNGGVMKPELLRGRILDIISSWLQGNDSLVELQTCDFDFAVARGAVYYGHACLGNGIRIRAGLNKTYYIGIAASMPAVPGMPHPVKALCIAPFGMEEGTSCSITEREFVLVVGEPARFELMASSVRKDDPVGAVVEDWEDTIEAVAAIETMLEHDSAGSVPVTLETRVTEIGTLEVWCVSVEDNRKWKLEFNIRKQD